VAVRAAVLKEARYYQMPLLIRALENEEANERRITQSSLSGNNPDDYRSRHCNMTCDMIDANRQWCING
jgi:hypothetical protein